MNTLINKQNNNTFLFFISALYIVGWVFSNDSFVFHRDEMWYALYSTSFTDLDTNDIRHIIPTDIHQVAFLPAFRYIQGFFIDIFGENIFGLRFINLFFGVILILFTSKLLLRVNTPKIFIMIFIIFMLFETQIMGISHKARPDFIVGALAVLSLVNICFFRLNKQIIYLYIASIFSVLALSMYWNGIAVVFSYTIVIFWIYSKKYITNREIIKIALLTIFLIIFLLLIPISQDYDAFILTFTNEGLMKNSGGFNILNILIMLKKTLLGGKYQHVLFLVFTMYVVLLLIVLKINDNKNKEISLFVLFFFTGLLVVLSLRSSSSRHLHMFLPVIYLGLFLSINFVLQKYKKVGNIIILIVFLIGCLFVFSSTKSIVNTAGQELEYNKLSKDIRKSISNENALLLTTYDLSWTVNNPKFYLENFIFQKPINQEDFDSIMRTYNIKYMIIDEQNKQRLETLPKNYEWYEYWNNYLINNYTLKSVIFNKYYRQNKKRKPQNKKGYKIEIWELK